MKYEEYGCFDIDEQQKIDNEVYENFLAENFTSIIVKHCLLYTSDAADE